MANTYERGTTFLKYLNVLHLAGSVPTFPDDYVTPTYEILFKNGIFDTIVTESGLTQGLDNVWFLTYTIPVDGALGTYLIKYKVTIDGVDTEVTEDFIVKLPSSPSNIAGDIEVTDIVQSDSMDDLSSVDIFVFDLDDLNNPIAHTISDSLGSFTLFLDAGDYSVNFNKEGFMSETHLLHVLPNLSHSFEGD